MTKRVTATGLCVLAAAVAAGVGVGMLATRAGAESAGAGAQELPKKSCCHHRQTTTAVVCPAHEGDNGPVIDDPAAATRMRRALRDGIYLPWVALGRAPTREEVAKNLRVSLAEADQRLDTMAACGQIMTTGILRVPQSDLIAVSWPFANVPTGITVTLDGGKPVFSRCAVDALGISKMLGRKAKVEAMPRDGGPVVRVSVDGDRLISAEPKSAVVVSGDSCDDISFFSSKDVAERWMKERGSDGKILTMTEALTRGARYFGKFTEGL